MSSNETSNGESAPKIPLRAGVYAPVLTFFNKDESLDLETQASHTIRLAKAGLVGLVAMGSNGEAVHLTTRERSAVITCMRAALDEAKFSDVPIIAGCSEQSVRGTLALCKEAAAAGASYALILPPCYYKSAMTANNTIRFFYQLVANESPIPVLMYNYPGAVAGVDMDSDLMISIAQHPNVVGAKFTCGNTGKLMRLAASRDAITYKSPAGLTGFVAMGGMADMIIQTMVIGGSGIIAGTANVLPKLCVRVWELCKQGKTDEAMKMQVLLAQADWKISQKGVPGTKALLRESKSFAYGGIARLPLERFDGEASRLFAMGFENLIEIENAL